MRVVKVCVCLYVGSTFRGIIVLLYRGFLYLEVIGIVKSKIRYTRQEKMDIENLEFL